MCSWGIACRCYSNYIFILDLKHGLKGLSKDSCKTRRGTLKFWNSVRLIVEFYGNFIEPDNLIKMAGEMSMHFAALRVLGVVQLGAPFSMYCCILLRLQ